jgi:hypothetical protein
MPHLTRFLLRGGSPDVEDVKKLITRATQKKTPKSEASALRSFSMIDVYIQEIDVVPILSINNLCSRLTVLHWRPWKASHNFRDVIISILKVCPKLVDFSCTRFFHTEIFHHLPAALEHLELTLCVEFLYHSRKAVYLEDLSSFVAYLRSGRCRALRTLSVVKERNYDRLRPSTEFDDTSLASICDDIGVSFSCDYW